MDLHNYQPSFSDFQLGKFDCFETYTEKEGNWPAETTAIFIRKTDLDQAAIYVPLKRESDTESDSFSKSSDEEYDEKGDPHRWEHRPISTLLHTYHRPLGPVPGNYVILFPRAPEVFPGQSAAITDLLLTRLDWKRIAETFQVTPGITRTILRNVPYFSAARLKIPTASGKNQVQISYTARVAESLPDDIALSSTYLPHIRTTYSVVYGCSKKQIDTINSRINSTGEDANHPLLMVGIFAELEYRRLMDQAEDLVDRFTLESDMLEHGTSWDPDSGLIQKHLEVCLQSRTLVDHIRTVKRQLAKVSKEIDTLITYWQSEEYTSLWKEDQTTDSKGVVATGTERMIEIASQMKYRISDIQDEYDDKIDECNKMTQNMSLAMQTGYNQIARKDAVTNGKIARANTDIAIETKRESSQMRYIALLTMIFLPLSCVASVFSTTIFNWEAEDGHPVVSNYIWVLLGVALILTIVTVSAWWFFTWLERNKEEAKNRNKEDDDLERGRMR